MVQGDVSHGGGIHVGVPGLNIRGHAYVVQNSADRMLFFKNETVYFDNVKDDPFDNFDLDFLYKLHCNLLPGDLMNVQMGTNLGYDAGAK